MSAIEECLDTLVKISNDVRWEIYVKTIEAAQKEFAESFSIDQIKSAFWSTFHMGGDVYFYEELYTERVWEDFEAQLNKTKETK